MFGIGFRRQISSDPAWGSREPAFIGQYIDCGFTYRSSYVLPLLESPPCDLVMTEIQPQLPKGENGPIKRDRKKASRQCQKTVLCIPNNKIRKPLTEKDVIGALCLR